MRIDLEKICVCIFRCIYMHLFRCIDAIRVGVMRNEREGDGRMGCSRSVRSGCEWVGVDDEGHLLVMHAMLTAGYDAGASDCP